jgi:hypothetical protein
MLMGFGFARRKLFRPHHKLVMTGITLTNWALIITVMIGSYGNNVAPYLSTGIEQPSLLLPTLHLITGATAQFLATYLVIMMWFEKSLPKWFVIHKIKTPMRLTLGLWLLTAVLGLGIYFVWNAPSSAGDLASPVSTDEAPISTEAVTGDSTTEPVVTEEGTPAAIEGTVEPVVTEEGTAEPVATEEGTPAAVEGTVEPVTTPESTSEATQVAENLPDVVATPEIVISEATPDAVEPVATSESTLEPVATDVVIEPETTPDSALVALLANPIARREQAVSRWMRVASRLVTVAPVTTPDSEPVATEDSGKDD